MKRVLFALVAVATLGLGQSVSSIPTTSGGGTGTVTSVATGCGLTGGTITATGTIESRSVANAQTGTTYTLVVGDCGKLVTTSNAGAITLTVPAAGGSFPDGWYVDVQNIGVGSVSCSGATCTLTTGQSARFVSDGTTWRVLLGGAGAGGTYTAGTGLSLAGNEFAINTAVTQTKASDQTGATRWCLGSGTAGAQTCSLSPVLTAYTTGMTINYSPGTTNTTTQTLNIDTLGVKSILSATAGALAAGDLTAGRWYPLLYDGTQWRLTGSASGGGSGDVTGPASATDYALARANGTTGKAIEFLASVGTSGQGLISAGAGAAPVWTTLTKTVEQYYPVFGGTSGSTFSASWSTLGTGYTAPTNATNSNPTRGYGTLAVNAGSPYGYLFTTTLSSAWDSTGNTVVTFFGNSGATTGDKTYGIDTACIDSGDTIGGTITFSATQTVTINMPTTQLLYPASITLNGTSLSGCSAGDMLLFRITRTDAVAGDIHFRGISLSYRETL